MTKPQHHHAPDLYVRRSHALLSTEPVIDPGSPPARRPIRKAVEASVRTLLEVGGSVTAAVVHLPSLLGGGARHVGAVSVQVFLILGFAGTGSLLAVAYGSVSFHCVLAASLLAVAVLPATRKGIGVAAPATSASRPLEVALTARPLPVSSRPR